MPEKIVIRQVQNLTKETTQRAGIILGTAFENDPVTVPILGGNRALAPQHFQAHFACAILCGSAYLASFSKDSEDQGEDVTDTDDSLAAGAAIWYGPGQESDVKVADQIPERRIVNAQITPEAFEWRNEVFVPLYKALADKCLGPGRRRDLYHLHVLGVHPSARRRGVASALVRYGLDIADKAGIEATLETCSAENIQLYKSLGFKVLGQTTIPSAYGDISMSCMLRPVGGRPVEVAIETARDS